MPVREGRKVLTSGDLAEMARRIGARPAHALRHLRREGYLVPLFRGFYYVRTPEEVLLRTERYDPLELFTLAARAKGIGEWYFGLTTALRLNGIAHEDRREETVVSRVFYRIHGVPIGSRRFVIHKWDKKLFGFGLERRRSYFVSDPEKTVLDLAYHDFWRAKKRHPAMRAWTEHLASVNSRKVRRYLVHYPEEIRRTVEGRL
ncbi:MAG: type IV toxin-antitoxin system AbiEi family antitoxin domain-containing protein [Thermoplasmata archaeon]